MTKPAITFFVRSFPPAFRGGGPSRSVAAMTEVLAAANDVSVITGVDDFGLNLSTFGVTEGEWGSRHGARCLNLSSGLGGHRRHLRELRNARPGVLYLSSLFDPTFSLLPLLLVRLRVVRGQNVVVSPRGELDPAALALKTTKKRRYLDALRRFGLTGNVLWHATTEVEKAQIEEHFGSNAKVYVAQNMANPPLVDPVRLETRLGTRACFVSRIDDKKNLLTAIEALAHSPNTSLTVFGPIHSAPYWEKCKELAAQMELSDRFDYGGELTLDEVSNRIADFDIFVFPTFGENFGHVVLEALAAGLPLLIANTTPWNEAGQRGAGWVLEPSDVIGFGSKLAEFEAMSAEGRLDMSRNARLWAHEHMTDPDLVGATLAVFSEARGS